MANAAGWDQSGKICLATSLILDRLNRLFCFGSELIALLGQSQTAQPVESATPPALPLTRIQRLIGRYMLASKRTKAYSYLTVRVDVTELNALRKHLFKQRRLRATTNDFFIAAMTRAALAFPLVVASANDDRTELRISPTIGIGFAVDAPQGLVVPVIKSVERKTLAEIAAASEELVKKARANKLHPDDFDGANLVLTGLGMFGIESFYAISPLSAAAIVSIGNIIEEYATRPEGFVVRKKMAAGLAFDSAVVDAAVAARYLKYTADLIENPDVLIDD